MPRDATARPGRQLGQTVTRRAILAQASTLLGAGLLAACGGAPAASPTQGPTTGPASAATPTSAPAATAASATTPAAGPTAVATAASAPAPAGAAKKGGSIIWALESAPDNLIPFGAVSGANQWGKEFMYDSLIEWDRNLAVRPALATSWEAPDDRTYVFHLREGVKFHDGKPLTADDVKYSIELQKKPPAPGVPSQYPHIDHVEVVDAKTVKFVMSGADPTSIGYLAWDRYSPIIPSGEYDKINMLTQGIGTGPFKLVEYVQNDHLHYVRNPDFWKQGLPYLDDLTLKILPDEQARVAALRSGAIDGATVSSDTAKTLQNDSSLVVLKGLIPSYRVIQFVLKDPSKPWHDKRVRQAVNFAINRQDIIDKVYGGDALFSNHIPPGYGDWPLSQDELKSKYEKFDVPTAKQLMSDAGLAKGFAVTLQSISAPPDYTDAAQVVKEQLKQINIDVTVQPLEIGQFAKNNGAGTFDWQLTGRGMRGDPDGFVHEYRTGTASFKAWFQGGWSNDTIDKLVDQGLATVDQAQRHDIYKQIQTILLDEFPHVPLLVPSKYQVVRSRLKNMYVSYTDFNTGLREAWVEG
jgi:peptide/nickel transport system substrate-binding protein